MTTIDSKSYFSYLNKLVDQYNNTYHHSINKKPVDYSALTVNIGTFYSSQRLKLMIESELLSIS